MYNSEYMYAIERSDEYLAHYGVRGMKWGVRKALAKGGVAGARALSKQYAKAQKKLAKLEKQAGKSKKYARRAALMGVGAAAAGGLAARGTKVVSDTLGGVNRAANALGKGMSEGSQAAQKFLARRGLGGKSIKLTGAMLRSGNALQRATSKGGSQTGRVPAGRGWGLVLCLSTVILLANSLRQVTHSWSDTLSAFLQLKNAPGKFTLSTDYLHARTNTKTMRQYS